MKLLSKSIAILCIVFFGQSAFGQCDAPLNLSVTYDNVTNQSTFTWDAAPSGTEYHFQLKFQWDSWDNPFENIGPDHSFSISGLATSFPFDWRVSTICNNIESAFSPAQNYTVPCPLPNGLSTTNITNNSAVLSWNPYPDYSPYTAAFVIAYRVLNSGAPWTPLGNSTTFSINIAGLQPNTTYEWCVNTTCSFFNSDPVISQFTTAAPPCNLLPVNTRSQSTTHNQNRVVWDALSGANNYTVQYKKNSETNWITINTNSNSLLLTGLDEETLYDWEVRANCTYGNGAYTTISQFHTYSAFCRSYGVNTWEWIDFFSLGSISRTSGQDVQGYFNSSQSTDLVIGSTGNAGQLSAGFNPGQSYTDRFVIYIDFNRNDDFNDPGERVLAPLTTTNGNIYNFSISIPNNVSPGPTKLKVVMRRGGAINTPCAQGTRGEVEDYVVNLISSSNMPDIITEEQQNNMIETEIRTKQTTETIVTPNPSNGIFNIQTSNAVKYSIYGALNHFISANSVQDQSNIQIDLSPYPAGVYNMAIFTSDGDRKTIRLIKI